MNPQEKISRLESLLERVRRNASAARGPAKIDGDRQPEAEAAAAPELSYSAAIEVEEAADLEVEELELGEDEFVDLTEAEIEEIPSGRGEIAAAERAEIIPERAEVPAAAASADESLDWEEVEEPPASSRRPIAAPPTLDEAIARASEPVAMDEGREIPLKTPPPESGPQESMPPAFVTPPLPEEPELRAPEPMIDLEPPVEAIELVEPVVERRAEPAEAAPESGEISPDVVQRPAASVHAAPSAYVAAVRNFRPSTFVELLDASLSLGE